MGCKCAKYDQDEGRYYCEVTGDMCLYLMPDSARCAADYGEGPDAEMEEDRNDEWWDKKSKENTIAMG